MKTTTFTVATLALALATGTALATTYSGNMAAGGFGVGIDGGAFTDGAYSGVTADRITLAAGSGGLAFTLVSSGGSDGVFGAPDFDVYWETAAGTDLGYHAAIGDESGTVPAGAAVAWIYLYDGIDASYTLTIG